MKCYGKSNNKLQIKLNCKGKGKQKGEDFSPTKL